MRYLIIVAISFFSFYSSTAQQKTLSKQEVDNWKKDIIYLADELPKHHKNLYHSVSKYELDASIKSLLLKLPILAKNEVVFELNKIITKIGDGHTLVSGLLTDPKVGFTYLPLGIYCFKNGTYIYAASKEYIDIIGGKILQIGNTKIEDVLQMLNVVIPHDNDMGVLDKAGLFLSTPEILKGLKLINQLNSVTITVEVNGSILNKEITSINEQRPTGDNWTLGWKFSKADNWVDARKEEKAIWLSDPKEYYWCKYIPEYRVMYFGLQGNANKLDDPLSTFTRRVFHFIDSARVEKFVLDLRWNNGGNNQLNKSIVVNMIKSYTDQKGSSFTLINRHTFSAAQSLVNALEKYSNTIFIGEPTASNVNFYADVSRITLPNSGITIAASSLWWQEADPRDKRKWTAPQIAINYTWQDYISNKDPFLEEVFNYKPQKNLREQVFEKINDQDLKAAIMVYNSYKNDPKNLYSETENEINSLGYDLLTNKKYKEAIEVFKLNVSSYPLSSNAFDSLAEAYMLAGMDTLAIENYERSYKLDPGNYNALEQIKKLRINKK